MIVFLVLLIYTVRPCIEAKLHNTNVVQFKDGLNILQSNSTQNLSSSNYTDEIGPDINEVNETLLFKTFFNVLVDASVDQFQNIKDNIITNFALPSPDVLELKSSFADLQLKYLAFVRAKLKQIIESNEPFNVTDHFMIDFMDVSNYIFEKVLEYYIHNVKDKTTNESKWYRQTERQKFLRQQIKISINYIENHICDTLQICRDRYYYSDYIVDWLRTLMSLKPNDLKRFFTPVPEILEKHKHLIKSNIKFRQTIKYLINADTCVKKDTLDFIDEILTNPDRVTKLSPGNLSKSVSLLRELFVLIDGAYDVNDQNVENLESITEWLKDWVEGKKFDVHKILNGIVENIQLNIRIWPLDVQNKIYYVWSEVIIL